MTVGHQLEVECSALPRPTLTPVDRAARRKKIYGWLDWTEVVFPVLFISSLVAAAIIGGLAMVDAANSLLQFCGVLAPGVIAVLVLSGTGFFLMRLRRRDRVFFGTGGKVRLPYDVYEQVHDSLVSTGIEHPAKFLRDKVENVRAYRYVRASAFKAFADDFEDDRDGMLICVHEFGMLVLPDEHALSRKDRIVRLIGERNDANPQAMKELLEQSDDTAPALLQGAL